MRIASSRRLHALAALAAAVALVAVDQIAQREHGGARVRGGRLGRGAGLDALGKRAGGLPGVGQAHLREVADGGLREASADPVEDRPGAPLDTDAQRQAGAGGVGVDAGRQGRDGDRGELLFHQLALEFSDNFLTRGPFYREMP